MKLNNNDDSHNSGLNLLIYNMLLDIESHPAWVCGLKHPNNDSYVSIRGHTLRGCLDLNNPFRKLLIQISLSHPAWVCGLKLGTVYHPSAPHHVTPCVGVWIETVTGYIRT